MTTVLLVIHLLLALALVGVVLLQRSEGGGLGIGGGGGMGSLMSGRATADLLTRTTAILAACFMVSSLTLAYMAGNQEDPSARVLEQLDEDTTTQSAPMSAPASSPAEGLPAVPMEDGASTSSPTVPVDQ